VVFFSGEFFFVYRSDQKKIGSLFFLTHKIAGSGVKHIKVQHVHYRKRLSLLSLTD